MELAEALFHANWSSSCGAAALSEDSQTMAQLLNTYSIPRHADHDGILLGIPPLFSSDHGAESFYRSYCPQACNSDSRCDGYDLGHLNVTGEINTCSVWMGFCEVEAAAAANAASLPLASIDEETSSEDIAGSSSANPSEPSFLTSLESSPKRKSHVHGQDADSAATPGKKLRSLLKNGMNEPPKKTQNGAGNCDAGERNGGHTGQDAISCSSEEVSGSSQEVHGSTRGASLASMSSAAYDPNGKIRAGRGSATDPQSLYARKRRERINERLKILQNLVPNGTKVDISTMLEEAVQYVKFLRLQIQLLSSDDLWMYAPIAYNGMDIGLAPQSSSLT